MMNVLVAEPNEMLRAGIKSIVDSSGRFRVIGEASSRSELLTALSGGRIDVLLLEPKLGGSTGEGLIRQVEALAPRVAILGVSDLDEVRFGARLIRAGLKGLLKKKCEKDELLRAIDHVCSGRIHISAALAEGLAMGLRSTMDEQPHQKLTERELDVFHRLVRGEKINAIANTLYLSPKTVSTHKVRILRKLSLSSLSELIQYALEHGLVGTAHFSPEHGDDSF